MINGDNLVHVGGSFRDPSNRVFTVGSDEKLRRVLRGIDQLSSTNYDALSKEQFFQKFLKNGSVVQTARLKPDSSSEAITLIGQGWAGVLEHEVVPFISYPYEWSHSMLKDAALLHLEILEDALENGWTLKDATPFNIQFIGSRPVFIDLPSFEPWEQGEPWVGYRQFCTSFLTPLLLQAYLDLDARPIMRSYLDGIPPTEAAKYFSGFKRFRRGVLSHIVLPATVENRIAARERDAEPAKERKAGNHSKAMVVGLVQSMARLVRSLKMKHTHSDWSEYAQSHTYNDEEFVRKKDFVEKVALSSKRRSAWDIGCNTGTFSRIVSANSDFVIAVDADHNAVDKLYLEERQRTGCNITPLVMNLANMSPAQGWAGAERAAFDARAKPDLVLVLALIHHIRISANIPMDMFLAWLRRLDAEIVIEFVDRHDEMVVKLLTNKKEQYADYTRSNFFSLAKKYFEIQDSADLKGGKREIFHLVPA